MRDQDRAYNSEQVDILKSNIKNSSLQIVSCCPRNVHLEESDKLNMYIMDFLKKNLVGTGCNL